MKYFFIILILFLVNLEAEAKKIRIEATVNNHVITNYDLILEKQALKIMQNIDIPSSKLNLLKQLLVTQKIKQITIEKYNISEKTKALKIFEDLKYEEISSDLKNYIIKKINIDTSWKTLIYLKYKNKLNINMNEINQIISEKKISLSEKDKIIEIEKNKKLKTFSNTFLNELRKDYYIKYF